MSRGKGLLSSLRSFFARKSQQSSRPGGRAARSPRLGVELLEERNLLSATLLTDRLAYTPGETAILTGSGFAVGETVDLRVLHTDGTPNTGSGHDPWQVVDGGAGDMDGVADGHFTTSWYVNPDDSLGSTFQVTAHGGLGSEAIATFDSPAGPTGLEHITTDATDYAAGETVRLVGDHFQPDTEIFVRVTRPDGSAVHADGLTPGFDILSADSDGGFSYSYVLGTTDGVYTVDVLTVEEVDGQEAPGDILASQSFSVEPATPSVGPHVATDKRDYHTGDSAVITASGFEVGETIELQVVHTNSIPSTGEGHDPWRVTDGGAGDLDGVADGNFTTTWFVNPDDSLGATFLLTATGDLGSEASATFSDAVKVAALGANSGNQAANAIFSSGDLAGSITRITNATTFNALTPTQLRASYDVLLVTWSTPTTWNFDWNTRLLPYLNQGGGVIWEDPTNLSDLSPGVSGVGFEAGGNITISASVSGLTDGISNNNFVNNHHRYTSWDSHFAPFLALSGNTVGLYGSGTAGTGWSSGRMVLTGPDQDFHGLRGSSGAALNQYNFLLNEVRWVSGVSGNSPPTISDIANTSTDEDTPTGPISFTVGDAQTPAGSLTVTGTSSNTTLVPNANISFGGSGASRTVTVTPAANQSGTTTITVTVSDGSLTATDTFVLTVNAVNDAPSFDAIGNQTVGEDAGPQTVNITGISAGPNESQTVTLTATSSNTALIANPTISGSGATRTLNYQPVANANGTVTITVTADDGQSSNNTFSRTFTITVFEVNDAPTAGADTATTDEDTPVTIAVLDNDSAGPNESSQTLQVFDAAATNGNVAINANGTLTFTPDANFNGPATITYFIRDNGTTNGLADPKTATGTVTVTVNAVNDTPDAVDDYLNTNEDTPVTANLLANDSTGPANESSQTLTIVKINNVDVVVGQAIETANGSVVVNANGTVTYTPNLNYNGSDGFSYTIRDSGSPPLEDSASGYVSINAINDQPTADAKSVTLAEDGSAPVTLSGSDVETAGSALTFTVTSGPQHGTLSGSGANLVYTPFADYNGPDTFQYTVTDTGDPAGTPSNVLTSAPATVSITVTEVNDAPVPASDMAFTLEDHSVTFNVLDNDLPGPANEGAQSLTVISASALHGTVTINENGTLTYAPDADYFGDDTITYTVQDNGTTNGVADPKATSATVAVTVTSVNDVPSFTRGADQTVLPNVGAQSISEWASGISSGPANESDQAVNFIVSNDNAGLFAVQPAVAANGTLTFTPHGDFFGTATVTVRLHDTGGTDNGGVDTSAPQTFTITVTPVKVVDGNLLVVGRVTQGDDITIEPGTEGTIAVTVNGVSYSVNTSEVTGTIQVYGLGGNDQITVNGGLSALVDGGDGSDTIVATKNANFTLSNSSLTASDGMSLTLNSIEAANLTGGTGANTFNVSGWTGTGTVNGDAGSDTLVADKNANFTLSTFSLASSDGMSLALAGIDNVHLTADGEGNAVTVNGWSGENLTIDPTTVTIAGAINASGNVSITAGTIDASAPITTAGSFTATSSGSQSYASISSGHAILSGAAISVAGTFSAADTSISSTGDVSVGGAVSVASLNVTSSGSQTYGSLSSGDTTLSGTAISVIGSVSITGTTTITGDLAAGDTTITGAVSITGNVSTAGLSVTGNTTVTGNVNAAGVTIVGAVSIGGDLSAGATTITSPGAVSVGGAVSVTSLNVTSSGHQNYGSVSDSGNAHFTGAAINVAGAFSADITSISSTGDVSIGGAMTVTTLNVTSSGSQSYSNINDSGNATLSGAAITVSGNVSATDASLTSTGGNIGIGGQLTASSVSLTATGSITGGSISAASLTASAGTGISLNTTVSQVTASTTSGDVSINETDDVTLNSITAGGNVSVTAGGNVTVGVITSTTLDRSVTISAGGAILDGNGSDDNITTNVLNLTAGTGIAAAEDKLETVTAGGNETDEFPTLTLTAHGGSGGIYLHNTHSLTIDSADADGTIDISAGSPEKVLRSIVSRFGNIRLSTEDSGDLTLVNGALLKTGTTATVTLDSDGGLNIEKGSKIEGGATSIAAASYEAAFADLNVAQVAFSSSGTGDTSNLSLENSHVETLSFTGGNFDLGISAGSTITSASFTGSNYAVNVDNASFTNFSLGSDNAAFDNFALTADNASFTNFILGADNATYSNFSLLGADNATFTNFIVGADNATFNNFALAADNATFANFTLGADNATFNNFSLLGADNATFTNFIVGADNATFNDFSLGVDNAHFTNFTLGADNATFTNFTLGADNATFANFILVGGDNASFANFGLGADNAAFTNFTMNADNASFANFIVGADNASYANGFLVAADNAAFNGFLLNADNAAFNNFLLLGGDNASFTDFTVAADNASFANFLVNADNATFTNFSVANNFAVGSDNATFTNFAVTADNASFTNFAVAADNAKFANFLLLSGDNAAFTDFALTADNATFTNFIVGADNASYANGFLVGAENATFNGFAVAADNAAFNNFLLVGGDNATFTDFTLAADNAAFANFNVTADNAAFNGFAVAADNAAFTNFTVAADNASFSNFTLTSADNATFTHFALVGSDNAAFTNFVVAADNATFANNFLVSGDNASFNGFQLSADNASFNNFTLQGADNANFSNFTLVSADNASFNQFLILGADNAAFGPSHATFTDFNLAADNATFANFALVGADNAAFTNFNVTADNAAFTSNFQIGGDNASFTNFALVSADNASFTNFLILGSDNASFNAFTIAADNATFTNNFALSADNAAFTNFTMTADNASFVNFTLQGADNATFSNFLLASADNAHFTNFIVLGSDNATFTSFTVAADNATFTNNFGVSADNAAFNGFNVGADNAHFNNFILLGSDNATFNGFTMGADNATFVNFIVNADNATFSNFTLGSADNATFTNFTLAGADNAAFINFLVNVDNAAFTSMLLSADNAAFNTFVLSADNATFNSLMMLSADNATFTSFAVGADSASFQRITNYGNNVSIESLNADFELIENFGSGATIDASGVASANSVVNYGNAAHITFSGGGGPDAFVNTGNNVTASFTGGAGDDTAYVGGTGLVVILNGSAGNDSYAFFGAVQGSATVGETSTDAGTDALDFSSTTIGPVNVDLTAGTASASGFAATLGNGVENVVGTAGNDIINGNNLNNVLLGAALPDDRITSVAAWNGRTQVALLDFDSYTNVIHTDDHGTNDHIYTQAERDAIQAQMQADYVGFHVVFTQSATQAATLANGGAYAKIYFNKPRIDDVDGSEQPGGKSDELDFRNLSLGGTMAVQINGLLGGAGEAPATSQNFVAASVYIAAHELAHMMGVRHADAYGPIGLGIHNPPGIAAYTPSYPGPTAAFETNYHLISSGASTGVGIADIVKEHYFGEREAVKLAFAFSAPSQAETAIAGTANTTLVVNELAAGHATTGAAQSLNLVGLATPNTLHAGAVNYGKQFAVAAVDVLASMTSNSEVDTYSFQGRKGDLINLEVISDAIIRPGYTNHPINSVVEILDQNGQRVAYYDSTAPSGGATNDQQFESNDSSIIDLRLPGDGVYYVKVTTKTADDGVPFSVKPGQYELFLYRFSAFNLTSGNDTLIGLGGADLLGGGDGNNVLNGGAGNDTFAFAFSNSGTDTVTGGGDMDLLDFSGRTAGVTVDLSKTGTAQAIGGGSNLILTAEDMENVLGTRYNDTITGNSLANVLIGGDGNDTLIGAANNDVLVGGCGIDRLVGSSGNDVLIAGDLVGICPTLGTDAGAQTWQNNFNLLRSVGDAWAASRAMYADLADNNSDNDIIDECSGDVLTGSSGADWFILQWSDKITDANTTIKEGDQVTYTGK